MAAAAGAAAAGAAAVAAAPPPPYVLVLGANVVQDTPALTETATINQMLHWIGFSQQCAARQYQR